MDVGSGTLFVGGAVGLALALFGVKMLVTGQAPAAVSRAFRTVKDAGRYHLLFGVALLLLVAGTKVPGRLAVAGSAVVAVALVAVAVIRYRPRRARPAERSEESTAEGERH